MSGKGKFWGIGGKWGSQFGLEGNVKYTTGTRSPDDDGLEEIAVVSMGDYRNVKYGSGHIPLNGPRVIPGKP